MDQNGVNQPQDKFSELRQRAEQELAGQDLQPADIGSLENAQRLITELRVHQIELEMQNDELRKAQDQLALEREKYADLYNFAPVAYFVFDERDVILDLNLAAAELLGGERKFLVGRPITPYITSTSLQVFVERREQSLTTGFPQTSELTLRPRRGQPIYVHARTIALRATQENGQLWRSVMIDITDRKQVEYELRKLTRAVEQSPASIVITDLRGNIEYVNPRFTQVTGYRFDEAVGKNPRILKTGQTAPEIYRQLWKTITAGKEWRGEFINRKKDGSLYYESAVILPVLDQSGIATHFLAVKEDITERKWAQETLRQQNEHFSILHQVTLDLLNRRNMDELLQTIVDRAVGLLDAPFVDLMLEKNGELIVQRFTQNQDVLQGDRVTRKDSRLSWQAFDTKLPAIVDDYSIYPYRRNAYPASKLHAVAAFPVLVRDKCIGVLTVGRSQEGYGFSEIQVKTGLLFSQLVALVLDSAQLFSEAQHEIVMRKQTEDALFNQNQFLAILHQTTLQLLQSRDVTSLLNIIVTQAAEFVGASYGNIFLSDGDELVLRAAISNFTSHIGKREKKPGSGVLGKVWKTMQPLVIENYNEWEDRDVLFGEELNLRAVVGIPIMGREGPLGVLEVARLAGDTGKFTGQEVEMFVQFAALASLVLDNTQLYDQAQQEREKADDLLLNILPYEIAVRLKKDAAKLIADRFEHASILFADVVNFTQLSASLAAEELIQLLDEIFSHFDMLVEERGLEKIKTIGDCYMVVAGVPRPRPDHAAAIVSLALEFQAYVASRKFYGQSIALRIGINSGSVVAGVIGSKKFAYDLWGDTVNIASRMESQGTANAIQITEATYRLIQDHFVCAPREKINIKGKGKMNIWHVIEKKERDEI